MKFLVQFKTFETFGFVLFDHSGNLAKKYRDTISINDESKEK